VSNISVFPSFFFCFCALSLPLLTVRHHGTAVCLVLAAASSLSPSFCVFSVSTSLYCGLDRCPGRHTHPRGPKCSYTTVTPYIMAFLDGADDFVLRGTATAAR